MGFLALIPLKFWLVGGAVAAALTLYKCQIHQAEKRGGHRVIRKLQKQAAKRKEENIIKAKTFDKLKIDRVIREKEIRKIDNRKDPEKYNEEAAKLFGR